MNSPVDWQRYPCSTAFAISSWAPSATSSATEESPTQHISRWSSWRASETRERSAGKTETAWNGRPSYDVGSAGDGVRDCPPTMSCSCGLRACTTVAVQGGRRPAAGSCTFISSPCRPLQGPIPVTVLAHRRDKADFFTSHGGWRNIVLTRKPRLRACGYPGGPSEVMHVMQDRFRDRGART